jgi:hypothetical protein
MAAGLLGGKLSFASGGVGLFQTTFTGIHFASKSIYTHTRMKRELQSNQNRRATLNRPFEFCFRTQNSRKWQQKHTIMA